MRRVVLAAFLAASACTGPVERVTDVASPSGGPTDRATGSRTTTVVGEGIAVDTPFPNGEVGSPVSVTGTADVIGAEVTVRVLDETGSELASTIVEASCGDGCEGTFAVELFFFVERVQEGTIEVSGASATAPPPVVRVPVILSP